MRSQRQLELLAAVAAQRVEDVAGQALGVDADEDVLLALDLAADERHVGLAGQLLAEGDGRELAVIRRHAHLGGSLDEELVAAPVLDELRDGDHPQLVVLAEARQVGHAGHRPVVVHDLADDAGRE